MNNFLKGLLVTMVLMILTACGGEETGSSDEVETEESTQTEASGNGIDEPVTLTWATGSDGGGWYSAAGGIAALINEKNPNINIKVIPGGTLQNIPFLTNGEADIAWEQAPFLETAAEGIEPFDEVHDEIVA